MANADVLRLLRAGLLPWIAAAGIVTAEGVREILRRGEECFPEDLFVLLLPVVAWLAYAGAVPLLEGLLHLSATLLARRASPGARDQATARAPRALPAASALGMAALAVYRLGGFGGWPDDVLFGSVGGLLGSWVGARLLIAWTGLGRVAQAT